MYIPVISLALRNILPKTEHATSSRTWVEDYIDLLPLIWLSDCEQSFLLLSPLQNMRFELPILLCALRKQTAASDEWWWHAQVHVSTSILKRRFIVCTRVLGASHAKITCTKSREKKSICKCNHTKAPANDRKRRHWNICIAYNYVHPTEGYCL